MSRLRILLVPDFLPWILGTWAKQIARIGTMHDYYLFSQQMIPHYTDEWNCLLNTVDVVHFLNQFGVKNIAVPTALPIVNSIHHVLDTEEWEKQLLPLTEADAVMVVAEEWKAFLHAKGVLRERIHLFKNGVDTATFYPFHDKVSARKRLGIHSNTCLIGYSAKFSSNYGGRKGIEIFLEALKISASVNHKFGVLITGPGWDAAVRQMQSYGIEVYYRPFLPDRLMSNLYNALDMYVVTSRIEGGPVPLLESMACGVPVVTTPVGIAREYIQHGVNGLVIAKDDAPACAQAILHLLVSPGLRNQLANAALETVERYLTWDKTLAGIEELYEHIWQAKACKSKPAHSNFTMNPVKQRKWAINIDHYLWHQNLYYCQGYHEGLRGMLESSLLVGSKETPMLLYQTLTAIKHAFFHKKLLKNLKLRI